MGTTRDWHHTLMADFAALSWQLEATINRLERAPREAASLLELTRNMVKHCQAEARRIIWDLRAGDEPVGLLSQELSKALCMMGPRAELDTELRVDGGERPLPPVFVHGSPRIVVLTNYGGSEDVMEAGTSPLDGSSNP